MNDYRSQSVRENYNQIADEYAKNLFHELDGKPLDRELLDRFAAETQSRGRVCDIGCGPGQVARYLKARGCDVFGLDLSPAMVQQAQQLNPEIHFREGNMLELALDDISLAGIAAFYAIVNLRAEWLAQVFREMARVLMPNGLLLLAFHTGDRVVQVNEMWGRAIAMKFFFFDPESIRRKLEAAGFVVEHVIERGPYAPEVEHQSHRAYIFARKPCA